MLCCCDRLNAFLKTGIRMSLLAATKPQKKNTVTSTPNCDQRVCWVAMGPAVCEVEVGGNSKGGSRTPLRPPPAPRTVAAARLSSHCRAGYGDATLVRGRDNDVKRFPGKRRCAPQLLESQLSGDASRHDIARGDPGAGTIGAAGLGSLPVRRYAPRSLCPCPPMQSPITSTPRLPPLAW